MISSEEIKTLKHRIETLGHFIDIPGKRKDLAEKLAKTTAPDFWDDPKAAEAFMKGVSAVRYWVDGYDAMPTWRPSWTSAKMPPMTSRLPTKS